MSEPLETLRFGCDCSMQNSFSSKMAHSMALMLLEMQAELEEFAYQQDILLIAETQPLPSSALGRSTQA